MKQDSWYVLLYSLVIVLIAFSYQLRLFERKIDPAKFDYLSTSMWNLMITFMTIGYGDIYPRSHLGRLIGIIIAGFGVFYVALFVTALNNILEFESPEKKAFNLL